MAAPASQDLPPDEGSTSIDLCRVNWPPPQDLLQADHSPQTPQMQSTTLSPGHGTALQDFVSKRGPSHGLPKFSDGSMISRVLVIWPPSQGCEHDDQPLQSPNLQSFGVFAMHLEESVLQASTTRSPPSHGGPPFAANCSTDRLRSRWPLQSAVHALQPAHRPQRHGIFGLVSSHGRVPHSRKSSRKPSHAAPFSEASTMIERDLCCSPPPQAAEQSCQSLQAPNSQSTASVGHSCTLHAATIIVTLRSHGRPPCSATCSTMRDLDFCPPPQLAVQAE